MAWIRSIVRQAWFCISIVSMRRIALIFNAIKSMWNVNGKLLSNAFSNQFVHLSWASSGKKWIPFLVLTYFIGVHPQSTFDLSLKVSWHQEFKCKWHTDKLWLIDSSRLFFFRIYIWLWGEKKMPHHKSIERKMFSSFFIEITLIFCHV